MELRGHHWIVASGIALFAHIGVAAALNWQPAKDSGTSLTGQVGVELSIGNLAPAPGTIAAIDSLKSEPPQATEANHEEVTQPQNETPLEQAQADASLSESEIKSELPAPSKLIVLEKDMSEKADVAAISNLVKTEPDVDKTSHKENQAVKTEEPKTQNLKFKEIFKPSRKPQPDVIAMKLPSKAPTELMELKPLPEPPIENSPTLEPAAENSTASRDGANGKSGTSSSLQNNMEEANLQPSGTQGESLSYMTLLQSWLARHKEYPRRARSRRQHGTVTLHFVLKRDGLIEQYSIRKSSGYKILDREVEDMLQRAQPLPPFPKEMAQNKIELVVPIEFSLR